VQADRHDCTARKSDDADAVWREAPLRSAAPDEPHRLDAVEDGDRACAR
jgi:hypothetical protein